MTRGLHIRRWWVAGTVCLAVLVAWLAMPAAEGPLYEGKAIEVWLENVQNPNHAQRAEAEEFFQRQGGQIVPAVVRVLQESDSNWERWLMKRQWIARRIPDSVLARWIQRRKNRLNAVQACSLIGPRADAAVPELIRMSRDPDILFRMNAAAALGDIRSRPEESIPALMNILSGPKGFDQHVAMSALARFGRDALVAVPALSTFTNSNDLSERDTAREMILRIQSATWPLRGT